MTLRALPFQSKMSSGLRSSGIQAANRAVTAEGSFAIAALTSMAATGVSTAWSTGTFSRHLGAMGALRGQSLHGTATV
jgi:hypothetical protein